MPTSLHPQAKFDPIPPDLDLSSLVDHTPNLKWVQRVSRDQIRNLGQREFEKVALMHVLIGGKPLVIGGWDAVLPESLFNANWFEKAYDKKEENVRDLGSASDLPMTTGHYLRSMKTLSRQWTMQNFRDERLQRLYLKDIDCPVEWRDALQKIIHPGLFYLNENVNGDDQSQENDVFRSEASVAPAGDLMSSLPKEMRAQNLMCYIGHEGTYTPAHREMCASLGQNIMVEASDGSASDEKPGSSIWFMTESKDREVVREYFLSMLGHDIEVEKHFAQINAWKKAPFDVYVVDQRPGDFILIPPLAAHQVWNRGTRTMKVAWNRTTAETLDLALHEALPKARLVCRDEQYKNKAILYFTLCKYYRQLEILEENAELTQASFMGLGQDVVKNSPRAMQLARDFKKLLGLFTEILADEMFAYREKNVEFLEFDSCVTCSFCRSNIFNRFLTCKNCIRHLANGDEDTYDVCMECYAMGRSCACLSGLQWCEQWPWPKLVDSYESWRAMVVKNDGFIDIDNSPQPLEVARQRMGKKSVAQICQEALRRRPWKDITKYDREETPSESEPDAAEDKPKKKHKRKQKKGEVRRCHVCCHKDYSYRVHQCTNPGCKEAYCYGVLYRAFGMMPQKVLEDERWQCPQCQGICSCGACRRSGRTKPYMPKNTLLGHDTRPIADDRSVEALVDFRIHNLTWLKATGEDSRSKDSKRMQHLREQADNAKAQDATEQEQAERSIHANGDRTSPELYAAYSKDSGTDSHGIGDHMPNAHQSFNEDGSHDDLEPLRAALAQEDENPGQTMEASAADDQSMSLYPDPPIAVRQQIGLGYYEQDDTPDKILFDPYQEPTSEALLLDRRELPENVKKSIRAAKRKARRENEDPDFAIGKYPKRSFLGREQRRPRLESPDPLGNMDPALFGDMPPAAEETTPMGEGATQDADEYPGEENMQDVDDEAAEAWRLGKQKGGSARRYEANKHLLRHARPRTSYAEVDDGEIGDTQETTVEKTGIPPATGVDVNEAVGHVASADTKANPEKVERLVQQKPKRRGRPPKPRPDAVPDPSKHTPEETRESAGAASPDSISTSRRHTRSGKSAYVSEGQVDAAAAPETVESAVESKESTSGYQGRLRSGIMAISVSQEGEGRVKGGGGHESNPGDKPKPRPRGRPRKSVGSPKPRPRGRPRKSVGSPKLERSIDTTGPDTQFMSMAERMALKGKKFKIGTRKVRQSKSTEDSSPPTGKVSPPDSEPLGPQSASVRGALGHGDLAEPGARSAAGSRNALSPRRAAPSARARATRRTPRQVGLGGDGQKLEASGSLGPSEESSDDGDIPARRHTRR